MGVLLLRDDRVLGGKMGGTQKKVINPKGICYGDMRAEVLSKHVKGT